MKQLFQNLKSGETYLEVVPVSVPTGNSVLIRSEVSLVSTGTERMVVEFGKAGYLKKARSQPARVRQVINKIGTDGLGPTINTVKARLDEPQPLGYSNVGIVEALGPEAVEFSVGERVVSNGRHAGCVLVPANLCAKVPEGLSSEAASFAIVGSIALEGVRLADPTLGETFVVFGLGLVGMLTAQILRANGCNVLGLDVSAERVQLCSDIGIPAQRIDDGFDAQRLSETFRSGIGGADGVIVTASTKGDEILNQSAQMCRKRGRVVLVGVVEPKFDRTSFYERELSLQVSCSYGPGRYDESYEDDGIDYPPEYVRWTANRNFQACLELFDKGLVDVRPLISRRVPFIDAPMVYDELVKGGLITCLLEYGENDTKMQSTVAQVRAAAPAKVVEGKVSLGIVGTGSFSRARLLPSLSKLSCEIKALASRHGASSAALARKHAVGYNTTDVDELLSDDTIDAVFITTRHDSHGKLTKAALESGKHVFVEKPLCITREEQAEIQAVYQEKGRSELKPEGLLLMIGFNRRFSKLGVVLEMEVKRTGLPLNIVYSVNAGQLPAGHWILDREKGGGRLLGEGCHFIDFCNFLVGSNVAETVCTSPDKGLSDFVITLSYDNGSTATIVYYCDGSKRYPKEVVQVSVGGRSYSLENFMRLRRYGTAAASSPFHWPSQDKGHHAGFKAFVDAVGTEGVCPIPFEELMSSTDVTFASFESAVTKSRISLPDFKEER
jgi:predicted dehydrogenase/threonine dehydrogenase-like Zn-dependent dehydrogenase